MKKYLFLALALLAGMVSLSYADQSAATTPVAVSTPETVVVDATMDGNTSSVTLNVDQDYSWKTAVEGAGLKSGDEGYDQARLNAIACGAAFDKYKEYREAGDTDSIALAETFAMTSVVRGWMEWRLGGASFGTYDDETGFKYDVNATADQLDQAEAHYKKADVYAAKAVKLNQKDAKVLVKRLASARKAIKDIKAEQARQARIAARKAAKAKKAASEDE